MKRTKTVVDREPVSSDYIASRQNFGHVLSQVKNLKPPVWKSAWFYGPVGMSIIAVVIAVATLNPIDVSASQTSTIATADERIDTTTKEIQKIAGTQSSSTAISQQNILNNPSSPEKVDIGTVYTQNDDATEIESRNTEVSITESNMKEQVAVAFSNPLNLPHINGVFRGEISVNEMCDFGKLECSDQIKIIGFSIQYPTPTGTSERIVSGNEIPDDVCESIKKYSNGHMVFFTDIKALSSDGKEVRLTSANFIATKS